MPSLTLLYLLTLLSLANISTGSAHNLSNSSSPSPTPTIFLTPGYPVIPDQTLADSDSSPSGPSIGIASYVSLLRNNDFYGQWVLTGNSNNLESFQNTNGIFELDAVASNTTYTGNYTPTTTVVNPNPARLLVETVDLDPEATDNESSDTNTLIQLLIKIYDGEYYDQQSIQIKYTLGSTGNLVFSPSMATIYENYQLSGLSFTKPDGTEVADQSCTLNISMTFFNENTLTPYQGPFTSPSALGITVNITSSDCDFSLQTSLLTTNGLYTKTQITVYIIVSCIIFMIQSAGVYLVRKSLEKKKYLFNMSASSIFFAVALDYYVLISNLVMVFADSTLLLIPLVFNIILTFGLERDVIIKLFQGRAKRPGTTLSDEDCKACGCYFVVIAVFFVIELAFLLMYQLWILYFTTLVLVPQIVQNIYKDRPYKFNYPYVFLMVAPKILMIAYLRLYSGNLFRISPDPVFAITYAVPILIQISMLAIQTTYPRFCLSAGHVRKARRALEEDDLCPICMGHLACNNSDISPTLPRRKTIQTTCTHSFHTQCLKKWLNTKTECPMCRNNIAELLEEVDFSEDETRSADLNSPDFRSPSLLRVQNVEYSGGAYLEHNL